MDSIVDYTTFDPTQLGEVGAVEFAPYGGPKLSQQGHILLYTAAHSTILAPGNPGVTEHYDAILTNAHIRLKYFGHVRGLSHSADAAPLVDTTATIAPTYWIAKDKDGILAANWQDHTRGWYDVGMSRMTSPSGMDPRRDSAI